jgi:hypothetical protein
MSEIDLANIAMQMLLVASLVNVFHAAFAIQSPGSPP